eukprot:1354772-Pleurochrysis_carterae.AAC.1
MRTIVGWFSSPSCALIYECSKYVALRSSKGYAIGAKFRQWLDAELHGKEEESFDNKLLGSVEDMMSINDRFSQTSSLRYLEEEANLGAKAGGKLRNVIFTGFGSEGIMAAVRAMALLYESSLWMLLRAIGSDACILDVLPT